MSRLPNEDNLVRILDDEGTPRRLSLYYNPKRAGPWFDWLGQSATGGIEPNRVDALDLVAVTALSVLVPPPAAAQLLDGEAERVSALLRDIPADVDLWDDSAASLIADNSAAAELWRLFRGLPGVGWVIAHKLCARKRPRLLPVFDSVVKSALTPTEDRYWTPLRESIRELQLEPVLQGLHQRLVRTTPDATSVTLLRVLDVAVWTYVQWDGSTEEGQVIPGP
jgi:hypothetical protein